MSWTHGQTQPKILKSVSLTHTLGWSYKLWLKKRMKKKKPRVPSACCGFNISCLPQPSAHVQLTCESAENHVANVCNWKISWEYGRTEMGKLLVENKAELNLQSLAAQCNADSNQPENCTQSVLHMSFFTYRAEYYERVKPANILAQDSHVKRCSCGSVWWYDGRFALYTFV